MATGGLWSNSGAARYIHIVCLLAGILLVLMLPLKKEIWYDETVSILCAKGISHDAPALFAHTNTVSSATLAGLNTTRQVLDATVNDNANSFVYNLLLHGYTRIAGNSLQAYTWFSKLVSVATLLAFFFLCNQFFEQKTWTGLAIILLATDTDFLGMSHEIRAYALGIFQVTMASVYFYRYLFQAAKPASLLWAGLFSAAAFLTHFLAVYVLLGWLAALVFSRKSKLFTPVNGVFLLVPVAIIALFFGYAYPGLQTMSRQNHDIQLKTMAAGFSNVEVFFRCLKFMAINAKVVFPAFAGSRPVIVASFVLLIAMYIAAVKSTADRTERFRLHLLFWLSAGNSLFLAALCIKSHHYTALYFRYFSFCLPFCSLFAAYALYVFYRNSKIPKAVTAGATALLLLPSLVLFASSVYKSHAVLKYNHPWVAQMITRGHINRIEVPEWRDAFLVNSFLPGSYKIDYFRNPAATDFTLYQADSATRVPVIRIDE